MRKFSLSIFTAFIVFFAKAQNDSIAILLLPPLEVKPFLANQQSAVTFSSIDKNSIEKSIVNAEPSFLFSKYPSISFNTDAGGLNGYSSIRMRGIDQTRINFSLNNVPMNEAEDRGFYFSNFPDLLRSISSMQIQRGVGNLNFGNASFGGNILLNTPQYFFDKKVKVGVGGGSFYTFNAFAEGQSALSKKTAIYARASIVKSNGYKEHSGNFGYSGFASFLYKEKKNKLWINLLAGNQMNGMAWLGVSEDSLKINPRKNFNSKDEKDNFMQTQVQVIDEVQIASHSAIKACGYYTFVKGNYTFDLDNYYQTVGTGELYKYAIHSHEGGGYLHYLFSMNKFQLEAGAQGSYYRRYHDGSEKTAGNLYHNYGEKSEINLQTKLQYKLWRFNLNAGAQYRFANFIYTGDVKFDKQQWNFFNYQAGLNFEIKNNMFLYYSFGSNHREPSRNDMFFGNDNLYADSTGAPIALMIKPEQCFDHEFGFKMNGKKYLFAANLYAMFFKNEIALNGQYGPTGLPLKSNNTKSLRSGLELSFAYNFDFGLSLSHNSSHSYNFIKNNNEKAQPILTPNYIINQSVGYKKWGWGLMLTGRYQSSSFIDFEDKYKVPHFGTLDIEINKEISGVYCFAKFNNVLNKTLKTSGALDFNGAPVYFVQAPFNFYIGVNWQIIGNKNTETHKRKR